MCSVIFRLHALVGNNRMVGANLARELGRFQVASVVKEDCRRLWIVNPYLTQTNTALFPLRHVGYDGFNEEHSQVADCGQRAPGGKIRSKRRSAGPNAMQMIN